MKNRKRNRKTPSDTQSKGRNRRSQGKSNSKGYRSTERVDDLKSTTNDPAWYSKNPAMVNAAADLAFAYPTGKAYHANNPLLTTDMYNWPGIMTIGIIPTVGRNLQPTDPINVAAMRQFTYVRKNKAGSLPFDAPDLMCMTIAMADVYSYINFLYRIFATVQLYSTMNNFIPDALLRAQGVDASNLRQNMADFRWGVNLLIEKAASIAVPATTTLYARRAFLYQNVYTEGTSIKDQLYMYVPFAFGILAEDVGKGTSVKLEKYDIQQKRTVKQLLDFGTKLIDAVYLNADVQSMSAFILEAYGEGNLIKLAPLVEIVPLTPVFDIGVLEQFKNAVVLPNYPGTTMYDSCVIEQDATKGYLISNPRFALKRDYPEVTHRMDLSMCLRMLKLLSTTTDKTDAGLVLESSRLMVTPAVDQYILPNDGQNPESMPDSYALPLITGTEIPVGCYAWKLDVVDGHPYTDSASAFYIITMSDDDNAVRVGTRICADLSAFKFAPPCHLIVGSHNSAGGYEYQSSNFIWDVDNFTIIDDHELEQLHRTSILSLLATPNFNAQGI